MKNLQSLTLSLALSALTFTFNAQAKFYYGASINAQQSSYKKNNSTVNSFESAFSLSNKFHNTTKENGLATQTGSNFLIKQYKSESQSFQDPPIETSNGITGYEITDIFINITSFRKESKYLSSFFNFISGNDEEIEENMSASLSKTNVLADDLIKNKKFIKIGDYYYANFGKEEHGGMTLEYLKEVHKTLKQKYTTEEKQDSAGLSDIIDEQNMWADIRQNQIDFARAEHSIINDSASKNNISGSILLGYTMKNIGGFNPTFEASLDFGSLKAGSNKQNELEIKHNYSINLFSRIGYSFMPNTSAYVNLGVAFTKYNIKFIGFSIYDIDVNKFATSGVLGVGYEIALKNKYRIFSEVNYKTSLKAIKTLAGDVDANEVQFKIGFRLDF